MSEINFKEKIFLAGSSGMVGSSIYKALKENGYQNILAPKREATVAQ